MSRALDYLSRSRPEAIGHYMAFLRSSGERLDPRTRSLISVITKVHAQTAAGLRQYARRALRDGCTPDEIVDALMIAFPALGLSRILWAVDILLEMGLLPSTGTGPEDDSDAASEARRDADGEWHDAIDAAALVAGITTGVDVGGRRLLLTRFADDTISAFDARCPHLGGPVAPGAAASGELACDRHGRVFDARSGRCLRGGDEPLRRYPVRIAGERVELRLPADPSGGPVGA